MERTFATVSNAAKQAEEAKLRQRARLREIAEPCIWTNSMLTALVEGVKGGVWYSLFDKVYAKRTLERAW